MSIFKGKNKGKGDKGLLTPQVNSKEVKTDTPNEQVPRITDQTVEQHREEVLGGARKYIYPLAHTKHKIVTFSITLLVAVLVVFMSYTLLSLYRWQSTSSFMYQVTKVLPLPVARVGGSFISYESYLFELRHYIHYYENQQEVDFTSAQGKAQLAEQRKKSLDNVVNFTYIKKIAVEKNITVSSKEVDNQIALLRDQNKLGNDSKVFEDVLKDYWGWSVADFRRSIEQEILTNKVLAVLDITTQTRASAALADVRAGKDFSAVAAQYSDDTFTKNNGGELGFLVSKTDRNIPIQTIDALYKLQPGEVSSVIDIGYGLEIVKNLGVSGDKIKAAHIVFSYQDITKF
jgi:uncharacterized protein YkwD